VLYYRILYNFWQWQFINYWDDSVTTAMCLRPSSATEMNFQSLSFFECEDAWSGRARNQIRKEQV